MQRGEGEDPVDEVKDGGGEDGKECKEEEWEVE